MKQKAKLVTGLIIGFLAAIGLDQWTKLLAVNHLRNQPPYVIWDGVFEFLYSENRGAAFGPRRVLAAPGVTAPRHPPGCCQCHAPRTR